MRRIIAALVTIIIVIGLMPMGAHALEVEAKSAFLMDVTTGTVLFEQNAHEKLAPASVTKVMTLLLIMEAIDSGAIGWNDTVTASEEAAAKGGSQIFLKVGETMSVADMVKSIAVSSANDCACAMAEHLAGSEAAFVEKMNARAAELGMNDTNFVNCTGLDDDPEAANHKTSAHDIAVMSAELLKNHPDIKKYTTIWMDTVRDGQFGLSNTNKMVRFYPGATGLKTGFTSAAGYCLSASAQREGMELVAVVMGCETSAKRFAACKQLLDHGFANYALVTPTLPDAQTVPVKLGTTKTVSAILGQQAPMLIDKTQRNSVTTEVELLPEVAAPVSKGQALGTLTVKSGDRILMRLPLVAANPVMKLSFGKVFIKVLKTMLGG